MNIKMLTCRKVKSLKRENKKLKSALEVILLELEKNNIDKAKSFAYNSLRSEKTVSNVSFSQDWLKQFIESFGFIRREFELPSKSMRI